MEEILLWEFPLKAREWATFLFFWSGVAIWVGLAARFLIPARVVRGPWLTLCLGFVGSCLGPFALRSIFKLERFDPIGPCGLVASVLAAVTTLCLFYIVSFFFPARMEDDEENGENPNKLEEADDADERWEDERERRRRETSRRRRVDAKRRERGEYERRREYDEEDEDEANEDERESRNNERRRRARRR